MGKLSKVTSYVQEYGFRYTRDKVYYRYQIKYKLGKRYFPIGTSKEERQEQEEYVSATGVKISIVVPLYNTPEMFLRDMIGSVCWQTYGNWELCLVDASDEQDSPIQDIVSEYQREDDRILYRRLPKNDGIANNTNAALIMASGEYIGLLDHDDVLHPSALYWMVREIDQYGADFLYSDELSFDKTVDRVQSVNLKPDYGRESLYANNYICHFTVFEKKLLEVAGRFRKSMDGAQDYDLFLRMTAEAREIRHIPRVLYYWRIHQDSTAGGMAAKPYIVEAGRQAVSDSLHAQGIPAKVFQVKNYGTFYRNSYKVPENTKVLVVGENAKVAAWVKNQLTHFKNSFLVMDGSKLRPESDWNQELWQDYSQVVLVRDGFRPLQDKGQWLLELVSCLQSGENAMAAAKVYDTDGLVYHAGYCYDESFPEKIRPLYRGVPGKESGYMNRLALRQNVSLLGGAAVAVKREVLVELYRLREERGFPGNLTWGLFSDAEWFSMCFAAARNLGACLVTPYACFEKRQKHSGEYQDVPGIWELEVWRSFEEQWSTVLSRPDPFFNPWMRYFGKYYFLW